VGSSLESCTESVELSEPFELQGRRIRLIDTPGFDDSSKSDAEVLNTIANFLTNECVPFNNDDRSKLMARIFRYRNGRKLSGLIYFHRISDVRMGAISKRNFVMFQKLCGSAALANVVLATTRWSEVKQAVGEGRETELKTKEAFFKPVIDAGAPLVRYMRTPESAMEILNHLVGKPAIPLLIQKEMVDGGKRLSETEAGQALQGEIAEQVRRHEEDMQTLMEELEAIKQGNDEGTEELDAEVKELREKVSRLKEETQKISSAQLPSATSNVIPGKDIVETPRPPSRNTETGPPRPSSRKAIGSPSWRHENSPIPRPPSRNAVPIHTTPGGDGSIMSSNMPSSAPIAPSANVRPSALRPPSKIVPAFVNPSGHAPHSVPRPPSRNANTATSIVPSSNPAPSVPPLPNTSSSVSRAPSRKAPPSVPRAPPRQEYYSTTNSHKNNAPSSVAVPKEQKVSPLINAPSESTKPAPVVATSTVPLQDVAVASSVTTIAGSLPPTARVKSATMRTEANTNLPERRASMRVQRRGRDERQRTQGHRARDEPEEGILSRYFARAVEGGVIAAVTTAWEDLNKWWSA
jgi:polyhydroxyalkanoate synthesis regulator phasin